jgi:cell wall-associated NlpC family hydrolase
VRLQGHHSGDTFDFIPYGWGRRADAIEIVQQLNQGESAGNVCTCEPDCILEKVAGIDCSGLVGQIWNAPRFTTASIATFALSLGNDWSQLRPGDVVSARNPSQRHMMMVTAIRSNGAATRYDLIQASVGAPPKYCNGSVCITSWESSQLERLGYTIYRHPGLTDRDGG